VIVNTQSLGMRDADGRDIYALTVRVIAAGSPAHEVEISSHVPAAALALIAPGTALHATLTPNGDDRDLVIDWQARRDPDAPCPASASPLTPVPDPTGGDP
jgi:hypothetical protein